MGKSVREFILGDDVVKALEVVETQAAERAALVEDLLVRPTLAKRDEEPGEPPSPRGKPKQKAEPEVERLYPRTTRRTDPRSKRTGPMIDGVRQDAAPRKRTRLL